MVLNHEEIVELNIFDCFSKDSFLNGSYDLTISHLICMDKKVKEDFTLKPQGMVYVIFKEKLSLPSNIIGFAHVKTSLTKRGIMATNIGIIDPNYKGYISTLFINFGKQEYVLTKGDAALRVTFNRLNLPNEDKPVPNNNISNDQYIKNIKKEIAHLDKKFLNLSTLRNKVAKWVFITMLGLVTLVSVIGFSFSTYFQFKNSGKNANDEKFEEYKVEVKTLIEKNNLFQEQIKGYLVNLQSMQDTLKKQSLEIKKLKKLR